jgi:hypothetical protein
MKRRENRNRYFQPNMYVSTKFHMPKNIRERTLYETTSKATEKATETTSKVVIEHAYMRRNGNGWHRGKNGRHCLVYIHISRVIGMLAPTPL